MVKKRQSDAPTALEETLASFACEGIEFTNDELEFLQSLEEQDLTEDEERARVKEFLAQRPILR